MDTLHCRQEIAGSAVQFNSSVSAVPPPPSRTFETPVHSGTADTLLLRLNYMTALRCIALVVGLSASVYANPSVKVMRTHAYLSSERVAVMITQTGAQVRATFTFRFNPDRLDYVKEAGLVGIEVPIWLPDNDPENPALTHFWDTFGSRFRQGIARNNRQCFYDTLAFSAMLRSRHLETEAGLKSWSSHLDDARGSRIFAREMQRPEFVTFRPEGAACFVVVMTCPGVELREYPLTVSYRQPLVKTPKDRRFVYLPSFQDLPQGVTTADTNRYAIVVGAAAGCPLRVTNGDESYELVPGQEVLLSPRHFQPIRAILVAGSSESVQRTGGSRSAEREVPEPVAAAPRR
jgi:hypothetical protein